MILDRITRSHLFPRDRRICIALGLFWIIEAQIENWLAGIIFSRYEWEIVGPANIILFTSELLATIWGCFALFLGFWHYLKKFENWFDQKYKKGAFTTP